MKIEEGYWNRWEVYIEDKQGNRLPEHAVLHTPPKDGSNGKVTFFIECESQQEFAICTQAPPYRSFDADITYSVDGRKLRGSVYLRNGISSCRRYDAQESDNGEVINRHLQFCKLEMSEDGPRPSAEALASLGIITVSLQAGNAEPTGNLSRPHIPSPPTSTLNEKIKKGMQQFYIGGGSNVEWSPRPTYRVAPHGGTPTYEFRISYRTRTLLMAQEVIPNTNTVRMSDADSDDDNKPKSETDSDATAVDDTKPKELKRKRGGQRPTTAKKIRNNMKKPHTTPIIDLTIPGAASGSRRVVVDLTVDSDSE